MTVKSCKAVLVVEDDDDIREALMDILISEGYAARSARDGKEALGELGKMPVPSLVLLDLMMPGMNGWEFLETQKANAGLAGHKVVTISALRPTQSIEDPTPLQIEGALAKPLSLEGILGEVRKFCVASSSASL